MKDLLIKNAKIVNRGKITEGDILIDKGRIVKIDTIISDDAKELIDAKGKYAMPGIIDDQVHFREPGLTHKANIYTESRAAIAGGTTTFMEMPNTKPSALTQNLLEDKYQIAKKYAHCNYSFFMGASNDNLEEVLKTDGKKICGVKIFMGSSTGNMLVDNTKTLEGLFSKVPILIATHCEDEATIRRNLAQAKEKFGDKIPVEQHPIIRNVEGCITSSRAAVEMAKKFGTRLHILHISTKDELALFDNATPLKDKKITAEVCVHHLSFNSDDYAKYGTQIKCNPAIKAKSHQEALLPALLDDTLDIIATDHAPHTWEEKQNDYGSAPSGVPLIQHSLLMMIELYHQGKISIEKIVEKMCHAPADCFQIIDRGYLDEGAFADLVLFDVSDTTTVSKDGLQYKCAWSPYEGKTFKSKVCQTIVNGTVVYDNGNFTEKHVGQRVLFDRP
jgi:dihydroorotase